MTCWLALVLVGLLSGTAAADPADVLLALIPPDTAVCVVVRDLRGTVHRLAGSPFARWLDENKLLDPFLPPAEREKMRQAQKALFDALGSTPRQLLDDVVGDAVVLAYRPGPAGKTDDESGVILLHARDPERLASVLDRLNAHQRQTGELKAVAERDRYLVRTRADGGTEFVFRDGPLLAFSGQEAVLRAVIDRRANKPEAVSPAGGSLRRMGLADAAAVLWVHPPSLSGEMVAERDAPTTPPRDKAALAQVVKVWTACDGLAVSVRATDRLEVRLTAAVDPDQLPPAVKAVLYPTPAPTAWGAVPADALFAVGGRLDLPGLVAVAESFQPPGESASAELSASLGPLVGKANVPAVLAGVGPEWVAWAEAPASGLVPEWTVAVRLAPAAGKPVLQALDLGASLLRLAYNRDHTDTLDLRDETRVGRTVKSLVGGLPQRPSYGLADGFLVLASSPERVFRFKTPAAVTDAPVARLDVARLRRYLVERKGEVAKWLATQNGRSAADVSRELDVLAGVLQAINRVELRHTAADGLIRLTLDVEPVKPLK